MNPIDFMHPILDGSNRNEYILTEFSQIIRNINECFIYVLLMKPPFESLRKYDNAIEKFDGLSRDEIYYETNNILEKDFLKILLDQPVSDEELLKDYKLLYELYSPELGHRTTFEKILLRMNEESFVKKIYITDTHMDQKRLELLGMMFPSTANEKIIALNDPVSHVLKTYPDITTVFMNDGRDLINIFKTFNKKLLYRKYFLLNINKINTTFDIERSKLTFHFFDIFKDTLQTHGAYVNLFSSLCIEELDDNETSNNI